MPERFPPRRLNEKSLTIPIPFLQKLIFSKVLFAKINNKMTPDLLFSRK